MRDERALPARVDDHADHKADERGQQPAEVLVEQRQIFFRKGDRHIEAELRLPG